MTSVKIICPCGQKFRFNVLPVNGRMPAAVNCPGCGADATDAANQQLAQGAAVHPPAASAGKNPYRAAIMVLSALAVALCAGLAVLLLRGPGNEPSESQPLPSVQPPPSVQPTPAPNAPAPAKQGLLGIAVGKDQKTGKYMVTKVTPYSPAAKAGLAPGLLVDKINGVAIADKDISDVATLIRGPAGSKAMLELINPKAENKPYTIELTRARLRL